MSTPEADGPMKGWVEVPLSEVANVTGGLTKNAAKANGRPLPYLRVANVYANELRLDDVALLRVNEQELDRVLLRRGDLLIVEGNGSIDQIGRVALWDGAIDPCVHQNHLIKVRSLDNSLPKWLVYYLLSPEGRSAITRAASSTSGLHTLSISKVGGLNVRVAPRGVRAATVDALDSYLTRLDAATEGLKRVQANLKRYRASVLKAAVEGRLVPTEADLARKEGRDYEPASVLLERILKERRRRWEEAELVKMNARGEVPRNDKWKAKYEEPGAPDTSALPELPDGWCWATMDHFLAGIEAGKNFKCAERPPTDEEVGVVKVSAVTWGVFDEEESKTCTSPDLVDQRLFIREGDFLFSRANTIQLVGAAVIASAVKRTLMLSDKILRLRTVGQIERWLLAVVRSPLGRRQIEALSSGNQESMRNIGQDRIRRITVPLPPASEIVRVLGALDDCQSVEQHVASTVEGDLTRIARLRQAILRWAFEGKLVDQDPNDEPASVLLDRIRQAHARTTRPKRSARQPKRATA